MASQMLFNMLHHICVVVHDIDKTQAFFESIGVGPWEKYPPLKEYTHVATDDYEGFLSNVYRSARFGQINLQLCQPGHGNTPQRKFLDTRGEGVFHVSFEVPDLDEADQLAAEKGMRVLSSGRRDNGSGFTYYDTQVDAAGLTLAVRHTAK